MASTKTLVAAAAAALLASAPAFAAYADFTVAPPNGTRFVADKITGNYVETISFNPNGTFDFNIRWDAGQFVANDGTAPLTSTQTGLGINYGLYGTYTGTGTFSVAPTGVASFALTPGGSLQLFSTTAGLLATGSGITGTGNINTACQSDPNLPGYTPNCGGFGQKTSFNLTTAGSNFFVAPNPFYQFAMQAGQFNAGFAPTGTQTLNGSMDVWFTGLPPTQVPEPASIALVGLALAGIGIARRRKA